MAPSEAAQEGADGGRGFGYEAEHAGGRFTAYIAGSSYGRLSRRRRSQTDVVMSIEELSDYRELLALVEGLVDWQGAGEGSRRWRAIAKRVIREYYYEPSTPRSWHWVAEHPGRPDQSPFTGSDPLTPGSRRWQRLRARIIRERQP